MSAFDDSQEEIPESQLVNQSQDLYDDQDQQDEPAGIDNNIGKQILAELKSLQRRVTTVEETLSDISKKLKDSKTRDFSLESCSFKKKLGTFLKSKFTYDPWLDTASDKEFKSEIKKYLKADKFEGDSSAYRQVISYCLSRYADLRSQLRRKIFKELNDTEHDLQALQIDEFSKVILGSFCSVLEDHNTEKRLQFCIIMRSFMHKKGVFATKQSFPDFWEKFKVYNDSTRKDGKEDMWETLTTLDTKRVNKRLEVLRYYMSGRTPTASGEGRLTSPKFTLLAQACIRFFYNLRGDLNSGLKVYAYPYSGDNRLDRIQMWRSGEGIFKDKWRLGYFDLSDGSYEIEFVTTDDMQVSIDDVTVYYGTCSNAVCTDREYKCTANSGRDDCISHNSLCDVVKDCHSDELNCNYAQTNYFCQFENSVLCGIQQETFDSGEWIIINQTYTKSLVLFDDSFPDHSTGTDKGYFLFLIVNLLQLSKHVGMTMDVSLQQKDFCLTFWYRFKTEATFKVDIISSNTVQNLWTVTDRINTDWTKAQIQLPALGDATIKYTVIRQTPAIHSYYKPHLALDDFAIESGLCPQYVCPDPLIKCTNENFCYSPAERCDRKSQCSDQSDEFNCNCTESEFRCSGINGLCIPLSQKCDLIPQCLDGSDEADCESLKRVSCSFETPYLCGYKVTVNSTDSSEYRWIRNQGKTPSVYTGPKIDHTTGTGYYMYAEGNYGNRGDKARMESVYFTTMVNYSMTFYYHMYYKDVFTKSGGLEVLLKEKSGTENLVWFNDTTTGEDWKFACFNLPANQNVSLIFIANRHPNSIQEADIAVDDIGLKSEPCHDGVHIYNPTTAASSTTPTTTPTTTSGTGCATDQFKCNNGICIKQTDVCDGISDCINGEDEIGCPTP